LSESILSSKTFAKGLRQNVQVVSALALTSTDNQTPAMKQKILIIHEQVLPDAPQDVQDVLEQAGAVACACAELGYDVRMLPVTLDLRLLKEILLSEQPDVVFNLVEALDNHTRLIHCVPSLLEAMEIPFSGSGSHAILTTTDKILTKRILNSQGISTPQWQSAASALNSGISIPCPCIVKPVAEDGSCGINDDSVCWSEKQAIETIGRLVDNAGNRFFAEQYISGREFNVGLIASDCGVEALPVAEMNFLNFPEGKPRILNYASKWTNRTFEYAHTTRTFETAPEDRALLDEMIETSLRSWQMLDLSGYARVDFRVDDCKKPWVLEVNANPCISPDSGFVAMAQHAGYSYNAMTSRILESAKKRQ
jgi:D-alanine-D-alanine ligase